MFEIRPYDGTAEELSTFVVRHWTSTYGGKFPVPQWSPDYFRWQLDLDHQDGRQNIMAAYAGSRLAGIQPFVPLQFALKGEPVAGSQASWLSVSPEFRGQGVAKMLVQASRQRHCERGLSFQLGYAFFGHRASHGPRFWLKSQTETTSVARRAGFWCRILDPQRVQEWELKPLDRRLLKLTSWIFQPPRERTLPGVTIRAAQPGDVDDCLAVLEESTSDCDLRIVWNAESLGRQLGFHGFSKALVAEEGGSLRGFMTYHLLPLRGRGDALVGILDLTCLRKLSRAARNLLLDAVLVDLHRSGAALVLKLRTGDYPAGFFLKPRWLWRFSDSHVLITWAGHSQTLPSLKRLHVLWR